MDYYYRDGAGGRTLRSIPAVIKRIVGGAEAATVPPPAAASPTSAAPAGHAALVMGVAGMSPAPYALYRLLIMMLSGYASLVQTCVCHNMQAISWLLLCSAAGSYHLTSSLQPMSCRQQALTGMPMNVFLLQCRQPLRPARALTRPAWRPSSAAHCRPCARSPSAPPPAA